MDIAIGMIIGSAISIISVFMTMNHIINSDKKKEKSSLEPCHYDIEIRSRGNNAKGTLYLKKRKDKFYASR